MGSNQATFLGQYVEHDLSYLLDNLAGNPAPGVFGVDLDVDEVIDVERPHAGLLRVDRWWYRWRTFGWRT